MDATELDMIGRSVMVFWHSVELPRAGEMSGWNHTFKIALNAESIQAYYSMAKLIMDGIPAEQPEGKTEPFVSCDIHPACDGLQNIEISHDRTKNGLRLSITFTIREY